MQSSGSEIAPRHERLQRTLSWPLPYRRPRSALGRGPHLRDRGRELLFGFRHGSRYDANAKRFEDSLANPWVTFLPVTLVTADRFSRISAVLRSKGRPLPTNDIWIAAHAMESGADLLSFDGHFAAIEGLAWIQP